jgi:hypothetical protein
MDIASRLACELARLRDDLGPWGTAALLIALVAIGAAIGDHLQPASDPLVAAPLRWPRVTLAQPGWMP